MSKASIEMGASAMPPAMPPRPTRRRHGATTVFQTGLCLSHDVTRLITLASYERLSRPLPRESMNTSQASSLPSVEEVANLSSLPEGIRLCAQLGVDCGEAENVLQLKENLLRDLKDKGVRGDGRPVSSEHKQ